MDSSEQRCFLELRSEIFQVANELSCNVGSCMIEKRFRNDRTRSIFPASESRQMRHEFGSWLMSDVIVAL